MNSTQETAWSGEDALGGHMMPQEMDFSNLLDLGEMDVANYAMSEPAAPQPTQAGFHDNISAMVGGTATHDFAEGGWDMPMDMDTSHPMPAHQDGQENLGEFGSNVGQHNWQGSHTPQSGHMDSQMGNMMMMHQPIPPTPNSYEMHGGDPRRMNPGTMSHHQQAFLSQQVQHQLQLNQIKRDTFTPLVSPAVTPQDSTFQRPQEFTVPGAYFSPLSSPAIQAQNAGQHFRLVPNGTQPSTARTSAATSPIATEFDMSAFGNDSTAAMPDRSRKSGNRKSSTARNVATRSAVRQSPVTKAQKRKSAALSAALSSQDLNALLKDAQAHAGQSTTDSSAGDSISPEPLTDSLMGPPPRPGSSSTHQSPTLYGQVQSQQQMRFKSGAAPATPASLMLIDNPRAQGTPRSQAASGQTHPLSNVEVPALDDFVLPPSATSTQVPATPNWGSSTSTPRMTPSRKTPKIAPSTSASNGVPTSATSSPAISALTSPSTPSTPQVGREIRAKGSKRSSISGGNALISPALRPKISPSIKPLLPEGSNLSDTQHAYLLASKSNYTHLLEGTRLPGVSYPESLSSGLTSKRTSHKIAEQGRRNRINEALKEMQALLPTPAHRKKSKADKSDGADSGDEKDQMTADDEIEGAEDANKKDKNGKPTKESKAASAAAEAKAANSKAATVESAIEYIRTLQQERIEMAKAMQARDLEMEELRRKLQDAENKLGSTTNGGRHSPAADVETADTAS